MRTAANDNQLIIPPDHRFYLVNKSDLLPSVLLGSQIAADQQHGQDKGPGTVGHGQQPESADNEQLGEDGGHSPGGGVEQPADDDDQVVKPAKFHTGGDGKKNDRDVQATTEAEPGVPGRNGHQTSWTTGGNVGSKDI